ncbi:MFS permease [Halogeometricum pallidum JCM 14848]|uniref:MFS permease n=1 Tax=Halogeometricum pallidum JCM 14848 TaxID=1227487 RepID=M0D5V9_HALPD|nr:MFS transporter [Halogeometricum pallidum]ELZ30886.1 MFS permease [Halogeometricum pallidum JCM 14848]
MSESTETESGGSWRSVAVVAGWQTAASLCYYSIFAATGFVRETFGVSESRVGLFLTAALLGYTVSLFPSGAAVDGYGEKRVMTAGLVALGVAAVGVTLAPTYALLLLAGALLGAAYSTAMPGTNRGIVAGAPPGRANLAMGLKQVGVTAGSGVSSLLITGIAAVAAWQVGFWAVAVLAGVYAAGFAVVYRGKGGTGEVTWPEMGGLASNRAYVALVAAGFFLGASIFSMLGYTVLYVQDVVGTGAAVAGAVLAATQVTGSVGRIGAGTLADRLGGARGAATVALAQLAAGAGLFAVLVNGGGSLFVTAAVFVGLGVTIHGSTGVFYSCLSNVVDDDDIGAATAGGQTGLNTGGLLAPPAFGLIVESTWGYDAAWAFVTALALVGATLLFVVRRRV